VRCERRPTVPHGAFWLTFWTIDFANERGQQVKCERVALNSRTGWVSMWVEPLIYL